MVVTFVSDTLLMGIGHPLLDVSIDVSKQFLEQFELKANDGILGQKKHEQIVDILFDTYKSKVKLLAGGSVLNTMRFAQWVFDGLLQPGQTTFFGSIGNDEFGKLLFEQTINDHVQPLLVNIGNSKNQSIMENQIDMNNNFNDKIDDSVMTMYQNYDWQTGICVALNTDNGRNRSMIAFLGAARALNAQHVYQHLNEIHRARAIYTSGFLLGSSEDAIWKLIDNRVPGQMFAFNLSAPYVCHTFGNQLWKLIPHIDILFCNSDELRAFATFNNWKDTELASIVQLILEHLHKRNGCKAGRLLQLVITQDTRPVMVFGHAFPASGLAFPVPNLSLKQIVNTIGAGDAFVGGFLAKRLLNRSLSDCIRTGIFCARQIIQVSGCQLVGTYDEQLVNQLFDLPVDK